METTRSLEVSYRDGRPWMAYLHLPHAVGALSSRTERPAPWLLVDFGKDGTPLGLDFVRLVEVDEDIVDDVLRSIGAAPLGPDELRPLRSSNGLGQVRA